jgi:hypothetical protein
MIGDMASTGTRTAVVGVERTDEPFPFATYVAIASAREQLGPVQVQARHLPYGVWWDRLRPTVELVRPPAGTDPDATDSDATEDGTLPLTGVWQADGRRLGPDDAAYPAAAAAYRTGNGLF